MPRPHVLLHQRHAARRLDIEPAGIEAHTLSHQRDRRCAGFPPCQVDQPRGAAAGAADGMNHRETCLKQVVPDRHGEFRGVLRGKIARGCLEFRRPQIIGGRVDQIARQIHSGGDPADIVMVHRVRHHSRGNPVLRDRTIGRKPVAAERKGQSRQGFRVRRCWRSGTSPPEAVRPVARQERRALDRRDRPARRAPAPSRPSSPGTRAILPALALKPMAATYALCISDSSPPRPLSVCRTSRTGTASTAAPAGIRHSSTAYAPLAIDPVRGLRERYGREHGETRLTGC
jgi:hypothetical protein